MKVPPVTERHSVMNDVVHGCLLMQRDAVRGQRLESDRAHSAALDAARARGAVRPHEEPEVQIAALAAATAYDTERRMTLALEGRAA